MNDEHDSNRQSSIPDNNNNNIAPPACHLFNRDKLVFAKDDGLTIYDYTLKNSLQFSQGNWSLIRNDLLLTGMDPKCIDALEQIKTGPCAELISAFHIRRELIHYKKICLLLFETTRKLERELKQMLSFFYWYDGDDPHTGIRMNLQALYKLRNYRGCNDFMDIQNYDENDLMKQVMERHADGTCTLLDRKLIFCIASGAWMYIRGLSRSIHDARDIAKAICLSPRHPDGEAPHKLLHFPQSMYISKLCDAIELVDPSLSRRDYKPNTIDLIHNNKFCCNDSNPKQNDAPESTTATNSIYSTVNQQDTLFNNNKPNVAVVKGHTSLQRILNKVQSELQWPPEAVDFLSHSIIARGGFKALAIVEELSNYNHHLSLLPERLKNLIDKYEHTQAQMFDNYFGSSDNNSSSSIEYNDCDDDLETLKWVNSAAVQRSKNIYQLCGALKGCRENAKWIHVLQDLYSNHHPADTSSSSSSSSSSFQHTTHLESQFKSKRNRIFVAGDNAAYNQASAFVPTGFQFVDFISRCRKILDTILIPTMKSAIAIESWPPNSESKRTRVLAYTAETKQQQMTAGVTIGGHTNKKAYQQCSRCLGYFDSIWIRFKLCSICEAAERESKISDCCFFDHCHVRTTAFCTHYQRCFVCDAPHDCDQCRLYRGNGDVVLSLIETFQPKLLLLDFDMTLSSTKSGASPLPPKNNRNNKKPNERHRKEGHCHTIDEELKMAVLTQKMYGESHVVTRNSHKAEIEEFLRMNQLEDLSNHVHVVPKKKSKGLFIKEMFSVDIASCLFIDDDIRELTSDEWLRSNPNIQKLLFVRGLV